MNVPSLPDIAGTQTGAATRGPRDDAGAPAPGICGDGNSGDPAPPLERPAAGNVASRRGSRVFSSRNARFAYWTLARRPAAAFHMARVLLRFAKSAVGLLASVKWSRDRRPVLAIALLEHIGDIVAAEPIARLARETYPGHRIFWITHQVNKPLIQSYASVDRVITVGCLTEWMLLWRRGLTDVVWDLHVRDRVCNICGIPLMKHREIPDIGNYFLFGNILEVQCLCAGLPKLAAGPRIDPPTGAKAAIDAIRLPRRFVAIHCRSNDPRKDWPADRWRSLVGRILTSWDIDVVELGLQPVVATSIGGRCHDLCGSLSILETAEVIRRAALFVGIDSGLAHLANALGIPGVILLGEYLGFQQYMPFGGAYRCEQAADMVRAAGPAADLAVEAVFDKIGRRLRSVFQIS